MTTKTDLNHLLPHIFEGLHANKGAWCNRFLQRFLSAKGWPTATLQAFYPQGMADVIRALHHDIAEQSCAHTTLSGSQSQQIAQLLHGRLKFLAEQTENLRLCYRTGALSPWRLANMRASYYVADLFWHHVGDTTADGNAYSKRALLAKILWQADLVWLGDASPNFADTQAFIDRALASTKSQGQKWGKLLQPLLKRISA